MTAELDKEATARLDKAVAMYQNAENAIQGLMGSLSGPVPTRTRSRVRSAVGSLLVECHRNSTPHIRAGINLAYVRAGRAIDPKFRLDDSQTLAVEAFSASANQELKVALALLQSNCNRFFQRQDLVEKSKGVMPPMSMDKIILVRDRRGHARTLHQHARSLLYGIGGEAAAHSTAAVAAAKGYDLATVHRARGDYIG